MYPIAIAFLGAAGAWLAWRRNPLYAGDSVLRLFAVSVLTIAAAVLLVIAGVDHTRHRAEPVVLTTFLTVVILGTLALLYIVQAASTSEAAHLTAAAPPGSRPVYLHRRKVYYRGRVLFVLLLTVCALCMVTSPGAARYIVLSCAAMLALLGAFLLPAMYSNAVRLDNSLAALECDPWVHWRYTPEEWQRWSQAQLERDSSSVGVGAKVPMRKLAWILGLIAAGLLVYSRGSLAERVDYTLLCAGGILLTILVGSRLEPRMLGRVDESGENSREAYCGPDGLFANGHYTLWLGVGIQLVSASIDEREPRSAQFTFQRIVRNPYGPNRVAAVLHSVPVPQGRDGDLHLLQRELKARCPKARIALA